MQRVFSRGRACLVYFLLSVGTSGSIQAGESDRSGAASAVSQPAAVLSLAALEQMAMQNNPTLAQAAANIDVARGRAVQSGLYPNPTVGYTGERIGAAGTAGELQGVFLNQTIVTAGKLRLNRAGFSQEILQMEAQALAQQYRVVNGVRVRFYQLLAMQRLLDVRVDRMRQWRKPTGPGIDGASYHGSSGLRKAVDH